jgi:hypothetical protein
MATQTYVRIRSVLVWRKVWVASHGKRQLCTIAKNGQHHEVLSTALVSNLNNCMVLSMFINDYAKLFTA